MGLRCPPRSADLPLSCLCWVRGAGHAGLSHPSRFVSQRTSWALHPVCFLLRLLQFHPPFPSHPSLLTTPNLPPLHVEGESFHPHFSAKANRAWGRRVGRGSRRSVPSGSPLFSHPARSVRKHTHTHTRVRAGCFESHTCTHTHTRTCARRLLESPDARGSPAGLSHLPAWSSGWRCPIT